MNPASSGNEVWIKEQVNEESQSCSFSYSAVKKSISWFFIFLFESRNVCVTEQDNDLKQVHLRILYLHVLYLYNINIYLMILAWQKQNKLNIKMGADTIEIQHCKLN